MNNTFLLALLGLVTICRVSFGAESCSKTNASSNSSVEVKCQILKVPMKVLEETGNDWYGKDSFPNGVCTLVGVFTKEQMDFLWKSLNGREGVLVEEVGEVTVQSGESGKVQKGYDFSYPVEYDPSAKPIKMGTRFLGTKLEVKPVVSDATINLSLKFEITQLKEITQAYTVKEADLMKKPTLAELVSSLPKNTVFNPVYNIRSFDSSMMLYTDQSLGFSMDDYENAELMGKVPPQKMKLKDPSKRHFLIITAKAIETQASKN